LIDECNARRDPDAGALFRDLKVALDLTEISNGATENSRCSFSIGEV
jgi:hypothetical protein